MNSYQLGANAERQFERLCTKKGWRWRKASPEEDAEQHWDYLIQRTAQSSPERIEVKSEKRLRRSDPAPSKTFTWLEWQGGGTNNAGWLCGNADWIAFHQGNGFLMCRRTQCLKLAEAHASTALTYSTGPVQLHQLYQRITNGRPRGQLILVKLDELRALPESLLIS
jgi:hypothetical protein